VHFGEFHGNYPLCCNGIVSVIDNKIVLWQQVKNRQGLTSAVIYVKNPQTKRRQGMGLKTRIWMTGSLDWIALIDGKEVWLGKRDVPAPLEEGDAWINQIGDSFKVIDGEIVLLGRVAPPERTW